MENAPERSLSEAAVYVLEQFERFNVAIPPSSRFKRMYDVVCNPDGTSRGYIAHGSLDFETAREALRDISQLEFFFAQIAGDSQQDRYTPIIKRFVGDSVLPQDDTQNSHGRDAQAEAFAFAVCRNACMNPVFAEPDVVCTVAERGVGIAVKRIKSCSQLSKRLKEASKQIETAELPGVISAEVTIAVNPDNYSIVTNQDENQVVRWWIAKLKNMVDNWDSKLWVTIQRRGVLGVFLHEHCPVCSEGQYVLRTMNYGIKTSYSGMGPLWSEFRTRFTSGLPHLHR